MRRKHTNRWTTCVLTLAIIGTAVGCQPAEPPPFRSTQGTWWVGTLTPDRSDRYDFVDRGTGLDVTAPASNSGGNLRLAAVKQGTVTSLDQQSCVTWHGPIVGTSQPGIILRARLGPDRTQAILVTNNVWAGGRPGINVHLADSDASPVFTHVGAVNMSAGLGTIEDLNALPWRFCARAIDSTVAIKAWSIAAHPVEPSWDDATYTATVELPPVAVYPGKPGVFVGHLVPGQTTVLSEHFTDTGGPSKKRHAFHPLRYRIDADADE